MRLPGSSHWLSADFEVIEPYFFPWVFLDAKHLSGGGWEGYKDSSRWTVLGWATRMALTSGAVMPNPETSERQGAPEGRVWKLSMFPLAIFSIIILATLN